MAGASRAREALLLSCGAAMSGDAYACTIVPPAVERLTVPALWLVASLFLCGFVAWSRRRGRGEPEASPTSRQDGPGVAPRDAGRRPSYSGERAERALRELDGLFRRDALPEGPVHDALRGVGIRPERCVAFRYVPDSGGTFVLEVVDPDGCTHEADVDPADPERTAVRRTGRLPRSGGRGVRIEDAVIRAMLDEKADAHLPE